MPRETAADYMEAIVERANLQEARKKVPGLKMGAYNLFEDNSDDGQYACIQGVAALASCASPRSLRLKNFLPASLAQRLRLSGKHERVRTACPSCCEVSTVPSEIAVAHVNDEHGPSLTAIKRILRRWIRQERRYV